MTYNIREITDKKDWDSFVTSYGQATFLQSWNWGECNKLDGDEIFRIGFFAKDEIRVGEVTEPNETLVGVALLLKVRARRGSFLFCPHGPLLDWQNSDLVQCFFEYVKTLGTKENVSFLRLSPLLTLSPEHENIFKIAGFRAAPIHMMHPELTWALDIRASEEEIMKNMRKTTRYLVRKAEKDGVKIDMRKDSEAVEIFLQILMDTASRQHFVPFSQKYLQNELKSFSNDDQIAIFLAKYNEKYIAGAMVVYFGEAGFYHHGASLAEYQKIPASYLIQWSAIREAKARSKNLYNFWGVVPETATKHPWWGLSLFKRGFGGFEVEYVHAQDFILKRRYWITWAIESFRRFRRGL